MAEPMTARHNCVPRVRVSCFGGAMPRAARRGADDDDVDEQPLYAVEPKVCDRLGLR